VSLSSVFSLFFASHSIRRVLDGQEGSHTNTKSVLRQNCVNWCRHWGTGDRKPFSGQSAVGEREGRRGGAGGDGDEDGKGGHEEEQRNSRPDDHAWANM
jgi:hypothetical protein